MFVGEINISRINETTLYMDYGRLGQAWLVQQGNTGLYVAGWDSDVYQFYLADGFPEVPVVLLDFTEPLTLRILAAGTSTLFTKDEILEELPAQPWDPNSC